MRKSLSVLFLGSMFQVFLDIIIDPVALQGYRWFLGQIYGYREPGIHFGVPLSNYLGWWLTGMCMMRALQLIDARCGKGRERPAGAKDFPFRGLLGPILYLSVIIFNLGITLHIGEYLMAITGLFIIIPPLTMILVGVAGRVNRYTRAELAAHLQDYPWSAEGSGGGGSGKAS